MNEAAKPNPTKDISTQVYVVTEKPNGLAAGLTFKGMTVTEETEHTVTIHSNPGIGLTRSDWPLILLDNDGTRFEGLFGEGWRVAHGKMEASPVRVLDLGLQITWGNAARRISAVNSDANSYSWASREYELVYHEMLKHAEATLALVANIQQRQAIVEALGKLKAPAKRATKGKAPA